MATTCKPEGTAVIDPANANNIIVTFVVRDAGNNIVKSQQMPGIGKDWTANKAKYFSETVLNSYLSDVATASATSTNLPLIQSFINAGAVLASG